MIKSIFKNKLCEFLEPLRLSGKKLSFKNCHKDTKPQSFTKGFFNIFTFSLLIVFVSVFSGFAQSNRSTLNDGVDKYEEKKYSDAEVDFRKVVESAPKNFEANFNLGTSYYKQEKYDDAIKSFQSAFESAKDNESRAKVFHNIGNALLKSNKLEQSVEAYKNALKFNPNDQDTKYNLSYALEMLKNKDKDKDKNDKNKNDKNDQKKDDQKNQQNQNQDQQNKDQNKQDQQQNQQPKDQEAKQDNTKQPQQPKEIKISKDEAQRILDALKNNEKDLQKILRKKSGKVKKTDKDW
ncbi:MAG: tetratricopeptide repeat protein [Ignavibacterium sp.]|nr:tetratricopeptide repeat protein [Ignavibacterium sp.]HRN25305.1 tetratricopeptide repeat protein [Ignavibacteriaceae bacterium]